MSLPCPELFPSSVVPPSGLSSSSSSTIRSQPVVALSVLGARFPAYQHSVALCWALCAIPKSIPDLHFQVHGTERFEDEDEDEDERSSPPPSVLLPYFGGGSFVLGAARTQPFNMNTSETLMTQTSQKSAGLF